MPATIRGERFNQEVPHYRNLAVEEGCDRFDGRYLGCVMWRVEMESCHQHQGFWLLGSFCLASDRCLLNQTKSHALDIYSRP
eukprot:scaffold257_cov85-Skeletonema_dohrnii-CCMP3373.AAC.3